MMKKLLIVVLSILFLSVLTSKNEVLASEPKEWDGSIKKPTVKTQIDGLEYYEISTAEELAYVAQTGDVWLTYNYILTNDIILNSEELYDKEGHFLVDSTKVNVWKQFKTYNGVFDGDGHTISGLYSITGGLFDCIYGEETEYKYREPKKIAIRNVNIKNAYIIGNNTSSIRGTGGLLDNVYSREDGKGLHVNGKDTVTISNCSFDGIVRGSYNVGGLVGTVDDTYYDASDPRSDFEIISCTNYGKVQGERDAGGIVGSMCSPSYSYSKKTIYRLSGCANEGEVSGSTAGGIVGEFMAEKMFILSIGSCKNVGKVSGSDGAGGIVGYLYYDNGYTFNIMYGCQNDGTIFCTSVAGGIIGKAGLNTKYLKIDTCQNNGDIFGTTAAGILGNGECRMTACVNNGTITGKRVGDMHSVNHIYDANGYCELCGFAKATPTPTPAPTPTATPTAAPTVAPTEPPVDQPDDNYTGIYWTEDEGNKVGYYYVDGAVKKGAGIVNVDGYLYYVLSTGKVAAGENKTISASKTNGLIDAGTYYFLSNGVLETEEVRLGGEIRWVEEGGKQVGYYYVMDELRKGVGLVEIYNEEAGEPCWYYVLYSGKIKKNNVADGKRVNQTVKANKMNRYTGGAGTYSFYEDGVMYDPYATESGIVKYDDTGKPFYYVDGHIRKDAGLIYVQRGDLAGKYIFVTYSGTLKKGAQTVKASKCNGHTEFVGTRKFDDTTGAMIIK